MTTDQKFVIPREKDDLLKPNSGQFYVKKLTPLDLIDKVLEATKTTVQEAGPRFIIEHFDDFFSVLIHENELAPAIKLRAFHRIAQSLEFLVAKMETQFPTNESRTEYLGINKMHAYILCSLMSYLEDMTLALEIVIVARGKTEESVGNHQLKGRGWWEERRSEVLSIIHRWLQLPLQNLWQPPIVEESFVQLIADTCCKILAHDKDTRNQVQVLEPIFQILGILVKNYPHKITCAIGIIQLVGRHEALAPYLATGVAEMVTTNGCHDFIAELARQIEQMDLEEASAENVSTFLETIATDKPELIVQILPNIIDYLSDERYLIKNCAINVLGVLIPKALTSENLTIDETNQRNECFKHLEMHMRDVNTYVRSTVFQVLQELCSEGAIPVERYGTLMAATTEHLSEEDATIRKHVLVLLQTLLASNAFTIYIDKQKIAEVRAKIARQYERMERDIIVSGDNERQQLWENVSPGIRCAIKDCIVQDSESREIEDDDCEEICQLIHNKDFGKASKKVSKISRMMNVSLTDELDGKDKERFYYCIISHIFMKSSRNSATGAKTTVNFRELKKQIMLARKTLEFVDNAEIFTMAFENALEHLEKMLFSSITTDAIEASKVLATAKEFGIPGAGNCIRSAITQVLSGEEEVRMNIAHIYRDMYLFDDSKKATVSSTVDRLICLFKRLQENHSRALANLIAIWLSNGDLTEQHIEMMWDKYAMKEPGTTVQDSRCAILLLAMVAQTQPAVVMSNIDIIMKIGLEPHENQDILLARDSCHALLAIKIKEPMEVPYKYPNHHKIFDRLFALLVPTFAVMEIESYISFAAEAINVIYHLAEKPVTLIEELLPQLKAEMRGYGRDSPQSAKLLYIVGHTVHSLKKKNSYTTNSTEDAGEEALGGATADDADAEAIENKFENYIINGNDFFSDFVSLTVDVCRDLGNYKCVYVQVYAVQALTMIMSLSSQYCPQRLQLLMKIREVSTNPDIQKIVLIGLRDILKRFRHEVKSWTPYFEDIQKDSEVLVIRFPVQIRVQKEDGPNRDKVATGAIRKQMRKKETEPAHDEQVHLEQQHDHWNPVFPQHDHVNDGANDRHLDEASIQAPLQKDLALRVREKADRQTAEFLTVKIQKEPRHDKRYDLRRLQQPELQLPANNGKDLRLRPECDLLSSRKRLQIPIVDGNGAQVQLQAPAEVAGILANPNSEQDRQHKDQLKRLQLLLNEKQKEFRRKMGELHAMNERLEDQLGRLDGVETIVEAEQVLQLLFETLEEVRDEGNSGLMGTLKKYETSVAERDLALPSSMEGRQKCRCKGECRNDHCTCRRKNAICGNACRCNPKTCENRDNPGDLALPSSMEGRQRCLVCKGCCKDKNCGCRKKDAICDNECGCDPKTCKNRNNENQAC